MKYHPDQLVIHHSGKITDKNLYLQESAAVQLILEAGLMKDGGELSEDGKRGQSNVKEIRLICLYLHEAFIADPNLAKLVHFQVTTRSVIKCIICLM